MQIVDDLIPLELMEVTRHWFQNENLAFGWRAHEKSPAAFWHRNYVLPGTNKHHYDSHVWHPSLSLAAFLSRGGPLAEVTKRVQQRFFGDTQLTRVWANAQTFGDEASLHRDFPAEFAGRARSVVWYPVLKWDKDWGGDFIVMGDDGEIEHCAMVKPNRMVVFDGTRAHAARPISRFCTELRIAVSFGCEVVP